MAVTSDEESQERSCYRQVLTDWHISQQTERDEWAALQLRLARSRMQWRLILPRDVFAGLRFPGSSLIAQDDSALWLAPPQF